MFSLMKPKTSASTHPLSPISSLRKFSLKCRKKTRNSCGLGQLTAEKMFSYNIVREDDLIREIIIKNVDDERLKELKSSIRWTFEKMYEKMKSGL